MGALLGLAGRSSVSSSLVSRRAQLKSLSLSSNLMDSVHRAGARATNAGQPKAKVNLGAGVGLGGWKRWRVVSKCWREFRRGCLCFGASGCAGAITSRAADLVLHIKVSPAHSQTRPKPRGSRLHLASLKQLTSSISSAFARSSRTGRVYQVLTVVASCEL